MERGEKFLSFEPGADAAPDQPAPHMCKCGRAPWRKGQRNCVACNREANRKYRESLKRFEKSGRFCS
jgi:hypothetical protein